MRQILLLTFLAFLPASASAKTFTDEVTGVSVELPDDWKIPENKDYSYIVSTPNSYFGLRLKLVNKDRKTIWDAVNGMIERFEIDATKGDVRQPYRVIMITPFETETGLTGMRVITGNINEEKEKFPNVFHYLFENKEGKLVCACLYVSSGIRTAEVADALMLPNLRLVEE